MKNYRAKQRSSRELGLERDGRERLNKQVIELNAQVSQFSQLSQKTTSLALPSAF